MNINAYINILDVISKNHLFYIYLYIFFILTLPFKSLESVRFFKVSYAHHESILSHPVAPLKSAKAQQWASEPCFKTTGLNDVISLDQAAPKCDLLIISCVYILCSFQVKIAYINFLNHCYVDTEVEMKEIYTSNHMWKLFENFLVDICRVMEAVLGIFLNPNESFRCKVPKSTNLLLASVPLTLFKCLWDFFYKVKQE